jgi:phage-related minor tail protein
MRVRLVLASTVIALLATACGDDAAAPTTTVQATPGTTLAPGTPAVCGPLAEVVRMSDEFSLRLNGVMADIYAAATTGEELSADAEAELLDDFRGAFAEASELVVELIGHYDDAAALAEPELAADIVAVRDATTMLMPILSEAVEDADTFDEFDTRLDAALTDPAVAAAAMAGGLAALSIDEFSIPECGFQVSNS